MLNKSKMGSLDDRRVDNIHVENDKNVDNRLLTAEELETYAKDSKSIALR